MEVIFLSYSKIKEERHQIFSDFYNYKLPKRLPISLFLPIDMVAKQSDIDFLNAQYDYSMLCDTEAIESLCDSFYCDTMPVMGALGMRVPAYYQMLGAKTFKMGANGFMQHPEVSGMNEEDYDYFIEDPYACIIERIIPKLYTNLDPEKGAAITTTQKAATDELSKQIGAMMPLISEISGKKGYYSGPPRGSSGSALAPCDFMADMCRSFSGLSVDIRRNPNKVKEACEAIYPLMFLYGLPSNPHLEGNVSTPLHMPMYMREKDFVDIWLPTYKRLCEEYASLGIRVSAFCEQDWMRYLDILQELPAGMLLRFEYGDPQKIKDKLGKKFIIGQMYPLELLKNGTKQQVVDKAKELLDIMMPGGGYLFGFDKFPLMASDVNLENLRALTEFIHDYAVYPNAGEEYGTPLNSEKFQFDLNNSMTFNSKYSFDWNEFKKQNPYTPDFAKDIFTSGELNKLKFYMSLFN